MAVNTLLKDEAHQISSISSMDKVKIMKEKLHFKCSKQRSIVYNVSSSSYKIDGFSHSENSKKKDSQHETKEKPASSAMKNRTTKTKSGRLRHVENISNESHFKVNNNASSSSTRNVDNDKYKTKQPTAWNDIASSSQGLKQKLEQMRQYKRDFVVEKRKCAKVAPATATETSSKRFSTTIIQQKISSSRTNLKCAALRIRMRCVEDAFQSVKKKTPPRQQQTTFGAEEDRERTKETKQSEGGEDNVPKRILSARERKRQIEKQINK